MCNNRQIKYNVQNVDAAHKSKCIYSKCIAILLQIWLCGGRLLHVPCSHLGHIARSQPYTFPGGRHRVELFNYKRAIEVWMEPEYKDFIYKFFPYMLVRNATVR